MICIRPVHLKFYGRKLLADPSLSWKATTTYELYMIALHPRISDREGEKIVRKQLDCQPPKKNAPKDNLKNIAWWLWDTYLPDVGFCMINCPDAGYCPDSEIAGSTNIK